MKLRIGILAIMVSTVGLVGLINLAIDHAAKEVSAGPDNEHQEDTAKILPKSVKVETKPVRKAEKQTDRGPASLNEGYPSMSPEEKTMITEMVKLNDQELVAEMKSLQEKLNQGELWEKYDLGELSDEERLKARQLMERVALLRLENTRRRYKDIEPELKDPFYAHRESIRDIRSILDEE